MEDTEVKASQRLLNEMLQALVEHDASDLHLAPDHSPLFRIDGRLRTEEPFLARLNSNQLQSIASQLIGDNVSDAIPPSGSIDGAMSLGADKRFRYNVYNRLPGIAIAIRRLESRFRSLEELGLPQTLTNWCDLSDGLILVAGPTGSGKSTTLATLIDQINRTRSTHIITIEDPVEYLHLSQKSRIDQRQVGTHTPDFHSALISSLRQDPDVILVGEIRERETIRTALTAAETGHLVFATVHAPDCAGAIQRISSAFPADEQSGVLRQLSMNLRGVLTQHLVPSDGPVTTRPQPNLGKRPRVALSEVLQVTPAAANLIARGQFHNLYSFMETGAKHGMQTLEECLLQWVRTGFLQRSTALACTRNPRILEQRMARELGASHSSTANARLRR
ncbi:MAG: PilT/PilU family type 4a pilus ATPase [Verrucomicrobiota bacterium]